MKKSENCIKSIAYAAYQGYVGLTVLDVRREEVEVLGRLLVFFHQPSPPEAEFTGGIRVGVAELKVRGAKKRRAARCSQPAAELSNILPAVRVLSFCE